MTTVVATGVFSILHPGHVLFLEAAKKLGDKLVVIVATDATVRREKGKVIVPEEQRLKVVQSLKMVDRAVLGDENDLFKPISEIKPDVIAIGKDQNHDSGNLAEELKKRGLETKVVKIDAYWEADLDSSTKIIEKIRSLK
jgi:FAD synthetase